MAADQSTSRSAFTISSAVRGYHVYKDIWDAAQGEILPCASEGNNLHDPFAVSVLKNGQTVGHVPKLISAACSMFLRRNGTITCRVTGTRKYSTDLPQGGLEIPCDLTFTGAQNDTSKLKRIFDVAASLNEKMIKPSEKIEREVGTKDVKRRRTHSEDSPQQLWVRINGTSFSLSCDDYNILFGGMELTDKHINASQLLLKAQFPSVQGLGLTYAPPRFGKWIENYIQIIHSRSCHWVTASTIGCTEGTVNIYDSMYNDIDNDSKDALENIFGSPLSFSYPWLQDKLVLWTVDCLQ